MKKILIILLFIFIFSSCSSNEKVINDENKTLIKSEISEPIIVNNYDGRNETRVENLLFNKMNQYRVNNELRNLTYSDVYQEMAEEEMDLFYNQNNVYEYKKWQKVLYDKISFDENVENCLDTRFSEKMANCILKDFEETLLLWQINYIGLEVKFNTQTQEMFYFFVY